MSRLFTAGWETGTTLETGPVPNTSITVVTPGRLGNYAAEFQTSQAQFGNIAVTNGRTYFVRTWVRISSAPTANVAVIRCTGVRVEFTPTRAIALIVNNAVEATSAPLALNTWVRLDLRMKVTGSASDETELRIDGAVLTSVVKASGASGSILLGRVSGTGGVHRLDDLAVNDDQGASENTWPDPNGKIIALKPVADYGDPSSGQWRAGNGTNRFNLYDAVDSIPPIGKGDTSATITSQIYSDASSVGWTYDATLERYDSKLVAGEKVAVVQAIIYHGGSGTSVTQDGIQGLINPVAAEGLVNSTGNGSGTFPTDWAVGKSAAAYGDLADKATPPVLRLTKKTTPIKALVCGMFMQVEVVPAPTGITYDDTVSGSLPLSGTCADSWVPPIIHNNVVSGVFTVAGTKTETLARSDAVSAKLTLSGTCADAWSIGRTDSPTGVMVLSGSVVTSHSQNVAPVGIFKLSGFTALAGKEYTDTCAGVFALVGVISQTLAYTDQQTGKLVVSGTATDQHFITASDSPLGILHLSGKVSEFIAIEGQVIYDDFPAAMMPVSGRIITPGNRPDAGIGGLGNSEDTRLKGGRIVTSLTGRLRV